MYCQYFGLREAPFSIAPNPGYLYLSDRHREALAHLLYGVRQGEGFVLLTGEVGTGKTMVSRALLEHLPEDTDVAMVMMPFMNPLELLASICDELDIPYINDEPSLKDLTDSLHHFLLRNHARGRNTVLIIDEAQHLQLDVLEHIRLLTNLETNTKKLLQIIFIGQPELQTLLSKPALRQLSQRITAQFHIEPLSADATRAYIQHRLRVAGLPGSVDLFPPPISYQLYQATGGIPRLINIICDRMLLGCYARNKTQMDMATLNQAVEEVIVKKRVSFKDRYGDRFPRNWLAAGVLAFAILSSLSGFQFSNGKSPANPLTSEANVLASGQVLRRLETVPVIPVPTASPLADAKTQNNVQAPPGYTTRDEAITQLLRALNIGVPKDKGGLCEFLKQHAKQPSSQQFQQFFQGQGLRCQTAAVKSWSELRQYNRPAVLTLRDHAGGNQYAALTGINGAQATLTTVAGEQQVPLATLGQYWDGEFVFLWHPPAGFERPLTQGDRHDTIAWVARRFAEMDRQENLLSGDKFNAALAQRVKLFQRQNQLDDDGIIGLQTLLKINQRLSIDKTLDNIDKTQQKVENTRGNLDAVAQAGIAN